MALLALVVLLASGPHAMAGLGPHGAESRFDGEAHAGVPDCGGSRVSDGVHAAPEGDVPSGGHHDDSPSSAPVCVAALHCPVLSDGLSSRADLPRSASRGVPRRGGGDAAAPGLNLPPTLPPPRPVA